MSTGRAGTCVAEAAAAIERLAPPSLAAAGDNVGLQMGRREAPAEQILVALELTPEVAEEALAWPAQLIVLHHPAIYHPLRSLADPRGATAELLRLGVRDIAVYVAHTNLDAAPQVGTSDALAERLGLEECVPLAPLPGREGQCKVVTFVPPEHLAPVRHALAAAGAGVIGLYEECSFELAGRGGFVPQEGAAPYIGAVGRREEVEEVRLEMVAPRRALGEVVKALLQAHPYEEPAYDLYPLLDVPAGAGFGRVGRLAEPLTVRELAVRCGERLGVVGVRYVGEGDARVEKVAVCGGSGASLLECAAGKAEAYVTGDLKHHDAHEALALGLPVVDATHWGTEQPVVAKLAEYLGGTCAGSEVRESEARTLPWQNV